MEKILSKFEKIEISGPKIPERLALGFSGGVDSTVALDYLAKRRKVDVVFIDHVTDGLSFLADFAYEQARFYGADFHFHKLEGNPPKKDVSHENWWRNGRYEFFHSLNMPVVTAHHLDDCVETWIWSALRGNPTIIPYSNKNVIRPFRTCNKTAFGNWANRNNLRWHEDISNLDTKFTRNFIRHNMIKDALVVNPGLYTTIRNKVLKECSNL